MKNWKLVDLTVHGDERGNLIAIEKGQGIDFEIKRVFYIYSVKNSIVRGAHANEYSKFLLVALNGSVKIFLDDGNNQDTVELNLPTKGLFINNMVWKEMYDFAKDTILVALSNEYYNSDEYINDYKKFLKGKRK